MNPRRYLSIVIVFIFAIIVSACSSSFVQNLLGQKESSTSSQPYVVMLSLDGFRWNYASKVPTPNLDYIAEHGVKAQAMIPSFPTKTFPNHYTLATGLYPDHHGIINNNFYAGDLGGIYRIGEKRVRPTWYIPASLQEKYGQKAIPPGPDNPLGNYWMRLGNSPYGIHGTNFSWSVGRLVTCPAGL